jgi:hypothetical protein
MPSARKIAANRLNGRKSRGPRTLAGKTRASQNAKVHGLSGSIQHDQTVLVQIAKAICGENKNPAVFERALAVAECQMLVNCIYSQRINVIERLRNPTRTALAGGDTSLKMARMVLNLFDVAYQEYCQLVTRLRDEGKEVYVFLEPRRPEPGEPPTKYDPPKARDEHEAFVEGLRDLEKLARYEKRARGHRNRAIRAFIATMAINEQFHEGSQT